MKLQKNTLLALYSVLEFAARPEEHIPASEIAEKYGESAHHLAKVLSELIARFRREGVDTLRTMISSRNSLLQSFFRSQGMRAGHLLPLEMDLGAFAPAAADADGEDAA